METNLLVKLTSRAWSMQILAALHEGVPGRLRPLLASTRAGRTAFVASLDHVMELGLLERNPGHGHPLRPEFRLTAAGVEVAKLAGKILRMTPEPEALALLRRKWVLPVLAVTAAPKRFSAIRADLPHITDRALSKTLYQLENRAWVQRSFNLMQRLPRPTYMAIDMGRSINLVMASPHNSSV